MRNRNPWHLLLVLLGILLGSAHMLPAHAAGVVTNCETFGATATPGVYIEGTLGAALVGGGEVTFGCSGTIYVPLIQITINTRIDATGQNVTLNGSNATPYMFAITTGTPRSELELTNLKITQGVGTIITNLGGRVTLKDCTVIANTPSSSLISNQNTQGSMGRMSLFNTTVSGNTSSSATIFNDGEMILTNSAVSGNSATGAAGIYNGGTSYGFVATLELIDSSVSNNTATNGGPGGIRSAGQLTLTRSTVSDNKVDQLGVNGGGITNIGVMTVTSSKVSGNYAPGSGGGIHNTSGSASTITDSIVFNNTAGGGGGGINNYGGRLTIINSTLSGNTAGTQGGGIYNYAPLTLTHVTLADNSAAEGGSLYNVNQSSPINLSNTLFSSGATVANCVDDTNSITDAGYNLSSDGTCHLTSGISLPNTNPNLGPLADNGGPTPTHALLPGSPAIDRIPSGANGCGTDITTDQRGVTRPQGANCDIGAYEVAVVVDTQPPVVSDVSAAPNPTPPNAPVTLTATLDDRTTGNSNLASAEYNVDGEAWMAMDAADSAFDSPLEPVTATLTFTAAQAGTRTLCVRGTDAASNTSNGTACTTVTVAPTDTTPPDITPTVIGTTGNNGWYTSDVQVSWTVTDDQSSITAQTGCDSSTVTADTTGVTFTCSATSGGGTTSESVTIKRDTILPTITGNASPAANANGWNNSVVTVSFACTDATSGIATCTAPQTLGEGANQTANGTATDHAGNTASTSVTGISIDQTPPAVSVTGVTNGAIYTLGSVPTAGCETTDALSGVQTAATVTVTGGDTSGLGTFTASCTGATDYAGNVGEASATYQVTGAPPGPITSTFSTFNIARLGINSRFHTLFLLSDFTLGNDSNGIDPATEPVTLVIDGFTATIPAGAFRRGQAGVYAYVGTVNTVWIQALIAPLGGNRFGFQVSAYRANLTGIENPVSVGLMIGNDSGTTSIANAIIR